jgi:GAF domain-containing protein
MATIRDQDDLWRVMMEKIRPLVGFDDAVVITLSEDQSQYSHFLTASSAERKANPNYAPIVGPMLPIAGTPNEYLLTLGSPYVWHIEEMLEKFPHYPGVHLCLETGLNHCVGFHLQWSDRLLGLFQLAFNRKEQVQPAKFFLYKSIADQVAVAVANILANEEILEREREKQQLLLISNDLANVRVREDFWPVLNHRIARVFGESDTATLYFLKPNGKLFYGAQYKHESFVLNHASLLSAMREDGSLPIEGTPFEEILAAEGVFTRSVAQWSERYPDFWGLELCRLLSINQLILSPLRYQGKTVGCWLLGSTTDYSDKDKLLHKAVNDQLSVAVANILANEEILEREREKATLLSINEDIATVRNPVDLLTVINGKIKQLIPFYDTGVLIVEPSGQYHYDIAVTMADWDASEGNQKLQAEGHGRIPHSGSFVEQTMQKLEVQGGPLIENWEELFQKQEYPFFSVMRQVGYKETMVTNLKSGGKLLGTLWINSLEHHFFQPTQFPLFQAIADQIAIAVANILANEEILEREREKALLLSLSEDMATIRDREDLWRVMTDKLQPVLGFTDAVVFIVRPQSDIYYVLLTNTPQNRLQTTHYQDLASKALSLKGSIEEWIVGHDKPFIYSCDQFAALFPDAPGVLLMQQVGIKDGMLGVLRHGGQVIGSFHVHSEKDNFFNDRQLPLFQSICDQVAVAVANILANEEILEREREKATLLSISGQLATIRDKHDLFTVIFDKLRPVFHFDDAVVVLCDEERQYTRHLHTTTTNPGAPQNEHYQYIMSEPVPVAGTPYEEFLFNDAPRIYSYRYLCGQYPLHVGVKILKDFGLLESVFMPLRYGGRVLGTFEFHATEQGRFSESQMPLFRNVADQVAVAVANILANEEILEREREKNAVAQSK